MISHRPENFNSKKLTDRFNNPARVRVKSAPVTNNFSETLIAILLATFFIGISLAEILPLFF